MSKFVHMEDIQRIQKILVANRGEIAVRIIKSARKMGISTVAVYSEADRHEMFVRMADEAVKIGPAETAMSYLNIESIIKACIETSADAVHPGYGFLSEREEFAVELKKNNIVFIGPDPETIRTMGDKIQARRIMERSGVPVVPGYDGEDQSENMLQNEADRIGFPLMVKASAGGGGRGMRIVHNMAGLKDAFVSARREAESAFGDGRLFLEKFVEKPRHIEVQIFGDKAGNIVHLFERECSIQRRHQKIIEESPSLAINSEIRKAITEAAVAAACATNYTGAGTVEFIFSEVDQSFYFLEMNTRLQVEHPVTEMVTGIDLVEEQIRVAEGHCLSFEQDDLSQKGYAIEARLYAENPVQGFLPATGPVYRFKVPEIEGVRLDSGIQDGSEISLHYDPMIAKIIAHGPSRQEAIEKLDRALSSTLFFGPECNLDFLRAVINHPAFRSGQYTTHFIAEHLENFRGLPVKPGDTEAAKTAAGLLHYHGIKNQDETIPVSIGGGDLASFHPWEPDGFRLWSPA